MPEFPLDLSTWPPAHILSPEKKFFLSRSGVWLPTLREPEARLVVLYKSVLVDFGPGHWPRKQLVPWQDTRPLASQACLPLKESHISGVPSLVESGTGCRF